MAVQSLLDAASPIGREELRQSREQNAGVCPTLAEHELAEILVRGNQHGIELMGEGEDVLVGRARALVCHPDHRVARFTQTFDDDAADAFVGEPAHAARSGKG